MFDSANRMTLQFNKVAVNMEIKVPHESIERHAPASPNIVGKELAQQVHHYAQQYNLGYYPALEFFNEQGGIDSDLINAVENISWVAAEIVCNEVKTKLRPIFSSISIDSLHNRAFTLPKVRMGQINAQPQLAEHFTPDVIKLNLIATIIKKHGDSRSSEKLAESLICHWLNNRFERLAVTGVKLI